MGYRIVKINSRSKLETHLNYLVVRNETESRILLDEINLIIIENQQACLTAALVSELMNHNIRLIFCDHKHNPQGELNPYNSAYDTSDKIRRQMAWNEETKNLLWDYITSMKISNQATLLERKGYQKEAEMLFGFTGEVEGGDIRNREGLAAKEYFRTIFGPNFDRHNDRIKENIFLNYGYTILLSLVNREIASFGYLPSFGIHHIGKQNPYNLGCDLMEPFRPFIDEEVLEADINEENYKTKMIGVFGKQVSLNGNSFLLDNAVHLFCQLSLSGLDKNDLSSIPRVCFIEHVDQL